MSDQIVHAAHRVGRALNQRHPSSSMPLLSSYLSGDYVMLAEFSWTAVRTMISPPLIGAQSARYSFSELTMCLLREMHTTYEGHDAILEANVIGALCLFSARLSQRVIISEKELQQSFVISLMLSNKTSEDFCIENDEWADWSGIRRDVLTRLEIKWLQDLEWRVISMTRGENYMAWRSVAMVWMISKKSVLDRPTDWTCCRHCSPRFRCAVHRPPWSLDAPAEVGILYPHCLIPCSLW